MSLQRRMSRHAKEMIGGYILPVISFSTPNQKGCLLSHVLFRNKRINMENKPSNLPECRPGWAHLNGGTRRTPRRNEYYLNENNLKRGESFVMNAQAYQHLDQDIPYTDRWIVVPVTENPQ